MARPAQGLQPKHWKALELFEEGILSIKEIAVACKIPQDKMYDLFEGDTHKAGEIAHLFKEELNQITARNSAKVRYLVKDCKKLALQKINEFLRSKQKPKASEKMMQSLIRVMNSLNKATPAVEVGSFSITKGMTKEELKHEFARLTALARFASNGGRVSRLKSGESGGLPPTSS